MKRVFLIGATLLFMTGVCFAQANQPLLMREPAISKTQIVFSYAGDLWTVSRDGGEANRLTTDVGTEHSPYFSPDGKLVAFTGEYDGNVDAYIIPAAGGVPRRLTYHPGSDEVAGWTPDGKQILFVSARSSYSNRFARLFTIPLDGPFPTEVPLPMGYEGSYSPDGKQLAYVPLPHGFNAWKRYRGGMATPIWIANLGDSSIVKIPRDKSNDFNPMWVGDKIYFLSDRGGPITLFSYDTKTKKVAELIQNNGLDIKSASAGPDAIVYEQFGSVNLYDLKSGKSKKLDIAIHADMLAVRPKYEKIGTRLRNAGISPTGARALFEARGEIFTVPAEKGDARNLTGTPGVAERDPAWSPDGKWIAYYSDESGEYALHLRDQKGTGEVKKISLGNPPSFFYGPNWSPDSRKIAYSDKRLNIWYVDIEKGTPVKVDTLNRGGGAISTNWSPDSRWIVYTKSLRSWFSAVFVYSVEEGKSSQITDGMSDAEYTAFDKSGKYLYFTASTDIGPRVFGFDMSSYPLRPTRSVYLCVLKKDLPSPLAPESDEEKAAEEKKDEGKSSDKPSDQGAEKKSDAAAGAKASDKDKKEPPKVTIDIENISQRILALPIPARNFVGLDAGKANTLFLVEAPIDPAPGSTGATLHKFDWGGLVGIGGYPQLMDGGSVTAPHFAFYSPEGKWEVENHGVDPDMVIEFDPKAWREGHDLQLEKAVDVLQQELKKNPAKKPQRPPYPDYHKAQPAPGK